MATQRQLRVGIIGAGAWATAAHIPGFQACESVEVVAICDTALHRAQIAAQAAGVHRTYASVEAMLAGEQLDLVSIATPTATHQAAAAACIAAGLHVLCEKPLAYTVAQARAMADLARTSPVQTKVGFTMRYAPAMRRLRELMAEEYIGTPYLLQLFLQNGQFLDPAKPRHWKMTREHAGAGAIAEYGIHGLDIARWMFGDVTRVCATGRTFVAERPGDDGKGMLPVDVEDSCGWLMDFANGALGVCHAGWSTVGRAPGFEIRVFGSRSAIQVRLSEELPGSELLCIASADAPTFEPVDVPERLATRIPSPEIWRRRFHHGLIHNFVNEIRNNQPGEPAFEDGLRAQELLAAVVMSMTEGRWIMLSEIS
jgi:predicted dehydrogenase